MKRTYKISELSTLLKRGITPSYTETPKVMVINQKCIRNYKLNLDLVRYTDPEKKKVADEKYLKSFDILVNSTGVGTLGRVAQIYEVTRPVTADSHVTIVRPDNKTVDPLYFGYCLKSRQKHIESLGEGSTGQTELSRVLLGDMEIEILENFGEQKIVANFLKAIDDKIELNQQMNETLEEIAKVTFKSWFIEFDPVRAKAEGRPTGLSKEINDLFPDSFEDSELGKIPKNYKVGKLEELAKYLNRGVSPTYVENNGVYLVNQKCIRNGKIDFNLCKQSKEKSSMNERYLEKYDILLNSMGVGTLGRVAMFYKFDKKITADALVTIIKGESVGSSFFIYYFLERMEDYLNTISVGSTGQTSLKKEDILNLQVIIPPKNLLDEFGSQLSLFAKKKYLNNQENLTLRDLRDTLLPKLISGDLKVSDAESLIEEASSK